MCIRDRFDTRTNLSKEVEAEVRREYPQMTFRTVIPRTVKLSEAPGFGKPIILYDHASKGAWAYTELAKEVVQSGQACLLYTSDAADDLTRVDLGGRRIIKKK